MTVNELQDQVIEDFSAFDEWFDKYAMLIELGNSLPEIQESQRVEQNLIQGCQSRVWLDAHIDEATGHVIFEGDSDAVIVKGILSLLIRVLSDHAPIEIAQSDLYFIERIGLKEHLSPTRSNGLLAMVKQMKLYGLIFSKRAQ
ncbi:MAG: SufE family protein [Paludibacteraceae bacterium]|nr:SufE family protein [Paludibacteraceae bacterium]